MSKRPDPAADQSTAPAKGALLDARLHELPGYTMKRAANIMQADAARTLEPFGLRITTFSALSVICDGEDVTQSVVAQTLNMERSNTVVIIDTLEEAGLIQRMRVPTDRRSYALRATLKGITRRKAAHAALLARDEVLLSDLSPDERLTLASLLRRISTEE